MKLILHFCMYVSGREPGVGDGLFIDVEGFPSKASWSSRSKFQYNQVQDHLFKKNNPNSIGKRVRWL